MSVIGENLFYDSRGADLDDVLRARTAKLPDVVDRIGEADFIAADEGDLIDQIVEAVTIKPLTLHLDKAETDVEEASITLSDSFQRGLAHGETVRVPGVRVKRTIPFDGDADLWRRKTNPYSLKLPIGRVEHNKLLIGIETPADQSGSAKAYLDTTLNEIDECLERQRAQIKKDDATLRDRIKPLIAARKSRLDGVAKLREELQA